MGAAGAQNEHGFAPKAHPVGLDHVQKAAEVGVVAVQLAVPVHDGVHRADGAGPLVHRFTVGDDQLLVGDGHVDGLKGPLLQKLPGLGLGGQGVQLVGILGQQHLVDDL